MKILKFLMILVISMTIVPLEKTFAAETFYSKGTAYSTYSRNEFGTSSRDSSSSVAVIAASTYFTPGYGGKQNVTVYSRCDIISNLWDATECSISQADVRLASSYSNGTDINATYGFISAMYPKAQSYKADLSPFTAFVQNVYFQSAYAAYNILYKGRAIVEHSTTSNDSAGRIIFHNPDKSSIDVPSSVAASNIVGYYASRGISKGLNGNFVYKYGVSSGYLTAQGSVTYHLTIRSNNYTYPATINVKTAASKLTHTIGR